MLLKGVPWDNAKEGFSGWGSHPEWAVTLWSWEVGCAQLRELSPCHTPSKCGQGTWAAVWPLNVAEQRERNRIATWRKPVWHLCPFSTWRRQHSSKNPQPHSAQQMRGWGCGVRNICLLLLFYKLTELAGRGFGKCSSTGRENQVIKKAAVLSLSSLCVL